MYGCRLWSDSRYEHDGERKKIAMAGKTLVKLLMLLILSELLLLPASEASPWWNGSRRRRRRSTPPRPPPCDSSMPSGTAWANNWQKYFEFSCRSSQNRKYSLRYWYSFHRNCKEDRLHYFRCGYGPGDRCAWGHFVNNFDKPVHFQCPHSGYIAGVKSEYSGRHRDRRFGFRCCHKNGHRLGDCQHTPEKNDWDQPLSYTVPYGYYLVGVFSRHDNFNEDRRWSFEICKLSKKK